MGAGRLNSSGFRNEWLAGVTWVMNIRTPQHDGDFFTNR